MSEGETTVSLPDFVRDNVMAADPNNGRCLVTNNHNPTQLCHCVWRKAMDDDNLLDSLEWAWDMKRYRLNLDTRYNLFYADISIHFLFDHLGWLLLPEQHIIETYYNALTLVSGIAMLAQRGSFPVIENRIFDYHFVPLQGLEGNIITHIDSVQTEGKPVLSTTHMYPFKTLPIIKSHLHPKFAIVNAGEKMQKLGATNVKDFTRVLLDFPILRFVMDVYMAWVRPADLNDKSFNVLPVPLLDLIGGDSGSDDGDNDNDSDYDNQTIPYRPHPWNRNSLEGSPVRKRKRTCTEPAPQASGSKQKVLSKLSLSKHDHQIGARRWTGNRIRKWDQENCSLGRI